MHVNLRTREPAWVLIDSANVALVMWTRGLFGDAHCQLYMLDQSVVDVDITQAQVFSLISEFQRAQWGPPPA